MIFYQYVIYKNSVLATVIGIIGAFCWIAGAACLLSLSFAYGLFAIMVAFALSSCIAPAISERKENKQNGIISKRSFRDFIKESSIIILTFFIFSILLTAACGYHIVKNNNEAELRENAAPSYEFTTSELVEGRYIEEDTYYLLPTFAYEGDTEETATAFFALVIINSTDGGYCVPIYYSAEEYDSIETVAYDFADYLNTSTNEEYSEETFKVNGKTKKISKMDSNVYDYYLSELEYYQLTDAASPFFIDTASYLPPLTNIYYYILLPLSCIISITALILLIFNQIHKSKAKKEKQNEHMVII